MTTEGSVEPIRSQSSRNRGVLLLAAVALGLSFAVFAPSDWETGPARASLTFHGESAIDAPVEVGTDAAITLSGTSASSIVEVEFPAGIPVDAQIRATIAVTSEGQRVRVDPADLTLRIEFADGRDEIVPVTRWDDAEQRLEARRRPPTGSAVALAVLGLVVLLWVTEAVPLFVTSLMIPVIFVFTGVAEATAAMAPFFNPIIVLFLAGFLMAEALRRSNLDRSVAIWITAVAGRSAPMLFGAMLAVTAFLSMWMSNTAATAVLIPIAMAVTGPLHHPGFRRAVILGIAFAATIGGIGSAIGTPANLIAIEMLDEFADRSISFAGWFVFGLPVALILLPFMGAYLWRHMGVKVDPERFQEARRVAQEELRQLGPMTRDQIFVVAVFGLVATGWLTETFHGMDPGIVALAGAIVLFVTGHLQPDDLGNVSWASLLTFGGGLTLGVFLVQTGTSDYLAVQLAGLASLPSVVGVLFVALATLLLTAVAPNTASAAILIPLAIPLAGVIGVDPTLLVVVVAITSSLDFALVIGTPPTMMAYSTGLYTSWQIFRAGVVVEIVGFIILVGGLTWFWTAIGVV